MEFQKVIKNDDSVVMFAKMQCEGYGTGLEKHEWIKIINGRASDIYPNAKTPEIAFTKVITEDDIGKLLFKAMRAAPGFEVTTAVGDTPEVEHPNDFKNRPAHGKMHSLAVDYQRSRGGSYAQSYAHVYSHRDNEALRNVVRNEHLAATMGRMNG